MIDWALVLSNAIWISGAALALAVFSYANWLAAMPPLRLRDVLRRPALYRTLWAAAVLVGLGLGLTSTHTLETVLWFGLALFGLIIVISTWRVKQQP
jgi:hypothetical protein